jgi:ribosomal protein L11 methyltransferase
MKNICCRLKQNANVEQVWQELETAGLNVLFSSEGADGAEICALLPESISTDIVMNLSDDIAEVAVTPPLETDWSAQWAIHGHDFHDGFVHIDLKRFGGDGVPVIRLQPGPGFGDLSHPTTRLVLEMMPQHVTGKQVFDIGCGSGVLTLCAAALGASHVMGLDIDPAAVWHAEQNAELNELLHKTSFLLPEDFASDSLSQYSVALINMIHSEQVVAWESVSQIHPHIHTIISSGILHEDREAYLFQCQKWGWRLCEEHSQDPWLSFVFEV